METTTRIRMRASPDVIYQLASRVERWPDLLPHYRWVRVLREDGPCRTVDMAARRDAIPLRWTAVQCLDPVQHRITFRHIAGITAGMDVAWTLTPQSDGTTDVAIWHSFRPRWPLVPDVLIHQVVGRLFVDNVAGKTLRRIKTLAEASA